MELLYSEVRYSSEFIAEDLNDTTAADVIDKNVIISKKI